MSLEYLAMLVRKGRVDWAFTSRYVVRAMGERDDLYDVCKLKREGIITLTSSLTLRYLAMSIRKGRVERALTLRCVVRTIGERDNLYDVCNLKGKA